MSKYCHIPLYSRIRLVSPTGSWTGKHFNCFWSRLETSIHAFSALGVYDGRVYEALWNKAQTEPLNKSEYPSGYSVCVQVVVDTVYAKFFEGISKTNLGTRSTSCLCKQIEALVILLCSICDII